MARTLHHRFDCYGPLVQMPPPLAVIAMSGGVDSSVAAALLIESGYRVEAVSLRLWDSRRTDERICSDHRDAAAVAGHLGIAHTTIDQREAFERRVVQPFVTGYAGGQTPNPCMACNSVFKLGVLLDWAIARGAEVVATGHYARLDRANGGMRLRRGADPARDQSYFLFELERRQLERTLFPLGTWSKADVRRRAAALGLPVAAKLDSQDLCFGNPAALVASRGLGGSGGRVRDRAGLVLGHHEGVERFTVGQRRGLGLAAAAPLYVHALDASRAEVIVDTAPPASHALVAGSWNWVNETPRPDEVVLAQIRYRAKPVPARVSLLPDGRRTRVTFESPAVAVAPGQAVVVYRGDELLGGGWIEVSEA